MIGTKIIATPARVSHSLRPTSPHQLPTRKTVLDRGSRSDRPRYCGRSVIAVSN